MSVGATVMMMNNYTDARNKASDAQKHSAKRSRQMLSVHEQLGEMSKEIAELRLFTATLVNVMIRNGTITNEQFSKIVEIIDASDGVIDGRFDGDIKEDGKLSRTRNDLDDKSLRELAKIVKNIPKR